MLTTHYIQHTPHLAHFKYEIVDEIKKESNIQLNSSLVGAIPNNNKCPNNP